MALLAGVIWRGLACTSVLSVLLPIRCGGSLVRTAGLGGGCVDPGFGSGQQW